MRHSRLLISSALLSAALCLGAQADLGVAAATQRAASESENKEADHEGPRLV